MNTKPIRRTKWFWGWQDDKEEFWLQEMARRGLHLKSLRFGSYEFTQGEPSETVYRLDFLKDTKDRTSYLQLFKDAGWEHVGELNGWQYWRKNRQGSESDEIFTDVESKIQKYKRLVNFLLATLAIFGPMYIVVINYKAGVVETIVLAVMLLLILLFGFVFIKLQQRINHLKGQA